MIEYSIASPTLSEREVAKKISDIVNSESNGSQTTITVYPKYVESAGMAVGDSTNVMICAQITASLYSYPEVALLESSMATENGADFIEVALPQSESVEIGESYLQLIAEEIEDIATFSILIDKKCQNLEKSIEEAIVVAKDLDSQIISIGAEQLCDCDIEKAAQIVKNYNSSCSETDSVSLRLTIESSFEEAQNSVSAFVEKYKLQELYNSGNLIVRVAI